MSLRKGWIVFHVLFRLRLFFFHSYHFTPQDFYYAPIFTFTSSFYLNQSFNALFLFFFFSHVLFFVLVSRWWMGGLCFILFYKKWFEFFDSTAHAAVSFCFLLSFDFSWPLDIFFYAPLMTTSLTLLPTFQYLEWSFIWFLICLAMFSRDVCWRSSLHVSFHIFYAMYCSLLLMLYFSSSRRVAYKLDDWLQAGFFKDVIVNEFLLLSCRDNSKCTQYSTTAASLYISRSDPKLLSCDPYQYWLSVFHLNLSHVPTLKSSFMRVGLLGRDRPSVYDIRWSYLLYIYWNLKSHSHNGQSFFCQKWY